MQLDFADALKKQELAEAARAFKPLKARCDKMGWPNQAAFRTLVYRLRALPDDEQIRIAKDGMQLFEKLESATDAAGNSAPIAAVPWLVKLIATALDVPEDELPVLSQLSLENNIKIHQALLQELTRMDVFAEPSCAFPIVQALTEVDLQRVWAEVAPKLRAALCVEEDLGVVNAENRACLVAAYAHYTGHGKALDERVHTLRQLFKLLANLEKERWDIRAWANACRTAKNWGQVCLPEEMLARWGVRKKDVAAALSQVSGLKEVHIERGSAHFLPREEENIALFRDKAFLKKLRELGKEISAFRVALQWLETEKHPHHETATPPPCNSFKEWVSVNEKDWEGRLEAYLSGYENKRTSLALNRTRWELHPESAWNDKIYRFNKIKDATNQKLLIDFFHELLKTENKERGELTWGMLSRQTRDAICSARKFLEALEAKEETCSDWLAATQTSGLHDERRYLALIPSMQELINNRVVTHYKRFVIFLFGISQ